MQLTQALPPPESPAAAKSILVVEDERIVAKDLQQTLIALGYRVPATAASAEDAVRAARQHRPDLVLMDIRIEGAPDGIDAALALRRELGVSVVFVTAYADGPTLERAKAADPDGYLVKPVKSDALRSTVEIALHAHQQRRRLREEVAEQRRMQRELELADRLNGLATLAAGVAHEVNNPLAFIRSNLEYARQMLAGRRTALGDVPWLLQLRDALADAETGAERVRKIVADMRRFGVSRPIDGEGAGTDLVAVLAWAAAITRGDRSPRARLVFDVGELPLVRGDEIRIAQVFVNLMVNAARAIVPGAPDENRVTVRARRDGDQVRVDVADTGAGMSEEVLARVFEPFFTTRGVGEGTGLGLSIVHGIVSSLGGRIEVESRPGSGSRFRVLLPVMPTESRATLAARAPVVAPVCRILLVDDEPLLRSALRRMLERDGHAVTEAADGDQAFALIDDGQRFDVILTDLVMPGRSGMQLHAELQARAPDQARRLVFMTGGPTLPGIAEFLTAVPNLRLDKPFDPADLERLVAGLIEQLGRAPARREP